MMQQVEVVEARDQYADGRAARVWESFIGGRGKRTRHYRSFLVGLLRSRGCRRVLDVACGTGVDSVMLLEEGFEVVSVDASDQMLKHALRARWERRREPAFDRWVIEEADWLTLADDLEHLLGGGFDAVICLGNSFAHLPAINGDQSYQRRALRNFWSCVRPGGLLLVDHRNYDHILETGATPTRCIYYDSEGHSDIRTSVLYVDGEPNVVAMDYEILESSDSKSKKSDLKEKKDGDSVRFRLTYYPHRLERFCDLLREEMGADATAKHSVFADFRPREGTPEREPAVYVHLVEKPE